MSLYTPPALNAVDFPLSAFTPADVTPFYNVLTAYSPPSLSAVDFALTAYTQPTFPYVGWELLPAVGTQDLTASLFSNTNTFYAPTVGRGAVSLTPDLFSNTQTTFYGPTVDQSSPAQDLTPSLFSNESLFYSAVVSSGVIPNAISGGIGHGKRRKKHFIERDGEILLFDKAIDVEIYLYQESLVKEEPKKVRSSIKRAKKVEPQVLNKEALQKFVEVQQIQENVYELARIDIELLLDIYRKYEMWMDEQDVEILLLH